MINTNALQNYSDNYKLFDNQLRPYLNVAQGMESQFLNFLITEMRKTTLNAGENDSQELKYYQSILNDEYSKIMTLKNEGMGIQEIILKQILPKHLDGFYNFKKHKNNTEPLSSLVKKFQNSKDGSIFQDSRKVEGVRNE